MRAPAGQLAREAIEALVNADAHLVLCDQGKHPLSAGWQDEANRPTAEQAIAPAAAGGLLGVILSSINLLAVDVDADAAGSDLYASMLHRRGLVEQAIGEPLATVPTSSGGGHMLYRAPEGEVGNRKWLYGDSAARADTASYGTPLAGWRPCPRRRRPSRSTSTRCHQPATAGITDPSPSPALPWASATTRSTVRRSRLSPRRNATGPLSTCGPTATPH